MPTTAIGIKSLAGSFANDEVIWFSSEDWDYLPWRMWFQDHKHYSLYIGVLYISLTLLGRKAMVNKRKWELRSLLTVWNIAMTVFSFSLAVRLVPFFVKRLINSTLYGAVCSAHYENLNQILTWCTIFAASKPIEFIDTAFIILRKQNLHFIHWYHHATVVVVCWYAIGAHQGPANMIFYVTMNAVVHSAMYLYYTFRSLRIAVPRVISMTITTMQIFQMFIGIYINLVAGYYTFLRSDMPCDDERLQIYITLSVYLSYFFLFCRFFYFAYIRKPDDDCSNKRK